MSFQVRRSASRTYIGGGLLTLGSIGWLVVVTRVLSAAIPPPTAVPSRLWVALVGSTVLCVCASAVLRERSVLWQMPLQGTAAAALIVGATFPVAAIFHNQWLTWASASICAAYLVSGAAAAQLMRYLRKRFL